MDEFKRPKSRGSLRGVNDVVAPMPVTAQQRTGAAITPARTGSARTGRRPHGRMVLELPASDGRPDRHHVPFRVNKRLGRVWQFGLRALALILVVILATAGTLAYRAYANAHKVFKGTAKTVAALQAAPDPNLLKGEGDGRINMLLLGIGGPDHDGPDLTDTIMLASIDPVNHKAVLLSVPRDLWVTPAGQTGSEKINAVYPNAKYSYMAKNKAAATDPQAIQAGLTAIDQELGSVLDVPINYNVLVNFEAFQQAVDAVGGVTIDVPTELYDPTMAWENNWNPVLAKAGVQTMNGTQALLYARSRETSSDFARAQRQRALLLALKQKATTLGVLTSPTKISSLLNAFGNNVYTDLSISDASRLYSIFKQIPNSDVQSLSLAGDTSITSSAAGADTLVTTGMIDGQSTVYPKAGVGNYSAIQQYVRENLPDGYIIKENARVLVVNGSGVTSTGTDAAALLKSYGYNVVGEQDAASGSWYPETEIVNLSGSKDPYTKNYLQQRYNVTATAALPQGLHVTRQQADFVVVLGKDEATAN